jgi:hypothetical protein
MSDMTDLFGDVIHTYTLEQALEDGVLVAWPDELALPIGGGRSLAILMTGTINGIVERATSAGDDREGVLWDIRNQLKRANPPQVHAGDHFPMEVLIRGTLHRFLVGFDGFHLTVMEPYER